jgi:hypothetical protein
MAPRRAARAAVATILLMGVPRLGADDGKTDRAKGASPPTRPPAATAGAKPEATPSPEQLKRVLRGSLEMIRSIADAAAQEERQLRLPSPSSFMMRFSRETQADVLRVIGRAQARLGE